MEQRKFCSEQVNVYIKEQTDVCLIWKEPWEVMKQRPLGLVSTFLGDESY